MKKVLWIACLLCMLPFLGYTQTRAGLAMQDDEEVFGQAPVSKELPSRIQFKNIKPMTRGVEDTIVWGHAMYVPSAGENFGRYYEIRFAGEGDMMDIYQVEMYNDWYFSSAEYYCGPSTGGTPMFATQPVWAYGVDQTDAGFMNLNYETGALTKLTYPDLNMKDLAWDYSFNNGAGRMLGTKEGYIYRINFDKNDIENPTNGTVQSTLYDFNNNANGLQPITLACDLDGTVFFVSASQTGENSALYMMKRKANGSLNNPVKVADLDWAARKIQTMSFDHKTRELFWWACDGAGNTCLFNVQLNRGADMTVAANSGATLVPMTEMMTTEISGLIFEFDYRPYNAICINEEGSLLLDNNQTSNTYYPGQTVHVTFTAPECMHLDTIVVMNHETEEVIYTFPADAITGNSISFIMPAYDVDIDAIWAGNMHDLEVTWEPTTLTNALTTLPADSAGCGQEVTITYNLFTGYILTSVTATPNSVTLGTPNSSTHKIKFTMPDADVEIHGVYTPIELDTVQDICQWTAIEVPEFTPNTGITSYEYWFKKPTGSFTKMTVAQLQNPDTFNEAGTWKYYVKLKNQYGTFQSHTLQFEVIPAPKSIAITGEHYNCFEGTIELTVEGEGIDTLIGTFAWTKDGVDLATTTTPVYYKENIEAADAGLYNVIFTPDAAVVSPNDEPVCDFTDATGFIVNIVSLPNKPIIGTESDDDLICYNTSVELQWKYGVMIPEEYLVQWYTIDSINGADTVWTAIEGESDVVYTTDSLTESTTYKLVINYKGDYHLCEAESKPYTVNVRPNDPIAIEGDTVTCQGFVPAVNPSLDTDSFTNITWYFDDVEIEGQTEEMLHFEELEVDLLNEAGDHVIGVSADDDSGCTRYGTMNFTILPLPEVLIVNDITDDTARYNDNPLVEVNVCAGSPVTLTAVNTEGATMEWSWDTPDSNTTAEVTLLPTESVVYSVTGTNTETGCANTTSISIVVNARPVITWIHPAADTTYNMMTLTDQLVATPEGGIFTYIVNGDPQEINHPIEGGVFHPAVVGIGDYKLVYSYQDPETGCESEELINITIEKKYWSDPDIWDSTWYGNAPILNGRYEIRTPNQLGSLAAYVYGLNGVSDDFAGDTIWIMNDIDLEGYFYRPLTNFHGVIDGAGHIISNMFILEDNLETGDDATDVSGMIRNIGLKDARFTSVTTPAVINVLDDAILHNSFVTMPVMDNVEFDPETLGEIRNFYYLDEETSYYMDNQVADADFQPASSDTLLHIIDGFEQYEGVLEQWVWLQNDFHYRTWKTDLPEPLQPINYHYPIFGTSFVHHHYLSGESCEYGDPEKGFEFDNIHTRDIVSPGGADTTTYEYALSGETITYRFIPESDYVIVDSVQVTMTNFNNQGDSVFYVLPSETNRYEFNITLPYDSLYLPAYEVIVAPDTCRRDYWTDEGNYDPDWYTTCETNGEFIITSNEELAAFAHAVIFEGHDFAGQTVTITEGETDDIFLDMTGHYWLPVTGFEGILDGTNTIVDNLFIREEYSAMFVNTNGYIINFGIQDIDLPDNDQIASYVYNSTSGYNATVYNSFATTNPTEGLVIPIAVGEGITVDNTYTLDANGNMKDFNGNAISFAALQTWVANNTVTGMTFWDWKLDEDLVNYSYPIHNMPYDGGYTITYIPPYTATENGYINGPTVGHEGDTIVIDEHPDSCYDMDSLVYITSTDTIDILNEGQFIMPAEPVTVWARFVPKNWTLTVQYLWTLNGEEIADAEDFEGMHYEDEILIDTYAAGLLKDPEFPYELDTINKDTIMPCGNMTLPIYFVGKKHEITFCEADSTYGVEYTTNPADSARYGETVNLTITADEGISIMDVTITTVTGEPVEVTGTNGNYTFTMPTDDIVICAEFSEEYWDDYLIADISWFYENEGLTEYTLTTDSMLGGLAALVTGREWLVDNGYYDQATLNTFDFAGVTINVVSEQEEGMIDLIEHKWRPIGAQIESAKQFQGTFNGNGHQIINMRTVDLTHYNEERNGACQGFFGIVGDQGVVNDVYIQGTAEGRYFTAGVAAVNYGKVINCVANVTVRSEFQAGGIVCNNYRDAEIINSYCIADTIECTAAAPASKDAPTNNLYVGGVASFNAGKIQNCHSIAFLLKGNGFNLTNYYGGVVGTNEMEVSNCYWMVNPIEPGYGQAVGDFATFSDCAVIGTNTSNLMTTTAEAIASEYGWLYTWTTGEDGYPVFGEKTGRDFMDNADNELNVILYPNPTKDNVKIFSNNIQRVTVFNMFGQMVLDTEVNGNETTIEMDNLTPGVYMVRIATAEGTATRNVIVE